MTSITARMRAQDGGVHLTPTRSTFRWLAFAAAAFTLYGSLVPFQFVSRPFEEAVEAFQWVLDNRTAVQSRSDAAANVLLGVPLGFCLLAWRRLDTRPDPVRTFTWAGLIWVGCTLYAAAVEFAQLYFPGRTCSGSDILAQSFGALIGVVGFVLVGQRLVDGLRGGWNADDRLGPAGQLMIGYAVVVLILQLLPLDLTASPADWARKVRDGKAIWRPFAELNNPTLVGWVKAQAWIELIGRYLPVGLVATRLPRADRLTVLHVLAGGMAFAALVELAQLPVVSRTPSVSDVLIGGLAVGVGWVLGRWLASPAGVDVELALVVGQVWVVALAAAAWLPFRFDRSLVRSQLAETNWLPFASTLERNYLHGLEEAGVRVCLYGLFGVLVAAVGRPGGRRRWVAAVIALAVAILLEAGQLCLADRIPGSTELIVAVVGGWLGATVTERLRAPAAVVVPVVISPDTSLVVTPPPLGPVSDDEPIHVRWS